MAQISVTTLNDGPRNAIVHVSIQGDGSGELVDSVLIDPAELNPPLPPVPALHISKLWYALVGFDAKLEFDYLTSDTPVWAMPAAEGVCFDFDSFGGLTDRSLELDGSGKLQLTTQGLTADGFGSIVLWVRKA
jgi:hypothetical protein